MQTSHPATFSVFFEKNGFITHNFTKVHGTAIHIMQPKHKTANKQSSAGNIK